MVIQRVLSGELLVLFAIANMPSQFTKSRTNLVNQAGPTHFCHHTTCPHAQLRYPAAHDDTDDIINRRSVRGPIKP
jgi:hypothetical protein